MDGGMGREGGGAYTLCSVLLCCGSHLGIKSSYIYDPDKYLSAV